MAAIQALLLVLGAVFVTLGYRKTHRKQMLLGAALFVVGLGLAAFLRGFGEGFSAGYESGLATLPASFERWAS